MIAVDADDYILLIASIFFPQEKFGPGSSRPPFIPLMVVK
jgi:hypothetical protein